LRNKILSNTKIKTSGSPWGVEVIISMCIGYAMLMLCRTVVSVAGPAMLQDPSLHLDTASFGAILGWGTAGNLTGKLTNGILADKLGGSRVFIFAIGLAAVTTFIFGTLSSNSAFFALYFLTIFSKSAGWPSIANIIRTSFSSDRHGRLWGFIATSSRISSVATTLLLSSLLLVLSWRGLFFVAGTIALLCAIILPKFLNRDNTNPKKIAPTSKNGEDPEEALEQADLSNVHPLTNADTFSAIRHFIRNPSFWLISLGVSALAVLFEFQVFIPIYLSETFDLQPAEAGMASAVFPLGCLIAVFSGGFIFDKLSKKSLITVMGMTLVASIFCLLSLRFLGTVELNHQFELIVTMALIFLFGFAISPAYYIPMSVFSISFGGKHCGLLIGLIDALAYFGAMIFDFVGGEVANKDGGWQDFLLILIVTSVIATITMIVFLYVDYAKSKSTMEAYQQ
jgi:OPA family sugar phosphate sensor protein UhpC-like MFS transporter